MRLRQTLRLLVASFMVTLPLVAGLTSASASSANISHSYNASGSIPDGSLVSLDPARTDYVVLANSGNSQRLVGVAVNSNDSLLAVDAGSSTTQVATTGVATALVSTLNGPLAVGDQVSASPFNGIGMKAQAGSYVIGLAQTSFDNSSPGATSQTITDVAGHRQQIYVGYVRISIAIGSSANSAGQQLSGLQRFAKSLTGHNVSTPRIITSLVVTAVALVALITLIYASIYGGIVSIGRNPLAKMAIFRTIFSVLGMVMLMAGVAGTVIFLLLR